MSTEPQGLQNGKWTDETLSFETRRKLLKRDLEKAQEHQQERATSTGTGESDRQDAQRHEHPSGSN